MSERDTRVLVTIGLLLAYAAALSIIGFFVASAAFLSVHMLYLGIRKPAWIVAATAGLLAVAWGVFERFLGVPLPHGWLY